ncbi:hypothetical protein HPB49_021035 [Dermacentor silvarum]|uniref:Uncharacterized protein n=1 Tax=Dermacentor silvarum TaxID=543639 RepID=A0ACB8E362_DERSI|nr:hypothetical protein HPB49_021035 [Dermacentor silvarum]
MYRSGSGESTQRNQSDAASGNPLFSDVESETYQRERRSVEHDSVFCSSSSDSDYLQERMEQSNVQLEEQAEIDDVAPFGPFSKVCLWTSTITMKLPCKLAFEGSARNKAEALAAAAFVQYLVETGHVDKDLSPNTVLDQETIVANAPHLHDDEIEEEAAGVVPNNAGSEKSVDDIMTGWRLTPSSDFYHRINCKLMAKVDKSWNYFMYQRARQQLPIFAHSFWITTDNASTHKGVKESSSAPTALTLRITGKVCLCTLTITVKLPCKLSFEGSARHKAEALAAAALVQYLVETTVTVSVGTLASPGPPGGQLPSTQTQKTVRRNLTAPGQTLKSWTEKR